MTDIGRAPSGQALAVPVKPVSRLDPTGFDPSRIAEVVDAVEPKLLAPIVKRAADEFYNVVMETAEDYLRDNLDWNLKSHLAMLERENQRMRTELYEVDRKLGGNPMGHESRINSIGDLQAASNRYHKMIWAVARKHEGEERHETALRYIEEREARPALAAAARQGGDVQQAPGEAPQSGGDSRNAPKGQS